MTTMNNDVFTYFGETRIAQVGPRESRIGVNPISYKLSYINHLPVEVTVGWRSGLKFTLPSEPSMLCDKLIMRVEIVTDRNTTQSIKRLLSTVDENSTLELRATREAYERQITTNTSGTAAIVLDYLLTLGTLREFGGSVYYHEVDNVISLLPFDKVPPHPHSEEGRRNQVITGDPTIAGTPSFSYVIELVDNAGSAGDRYININNEIYKVPVKKDKLKRDGVYIVSSLPVNGELGMSGVLDKHYPFEGAEELLGLYKTYEDAKTLGDPLAARKRELTELEHKATLEKSNLQKMERDHKIEMIQKEKQIKDLELQREAHAKELSDAREKAEHEMVLERTRIKDYYESRSYARKDESEAIKFLPSIIVGLGAIFLAVRSIQGS